MILTLLCKAIKGIYYIPYFWVFDNFGKVYVSIKGLDLEECM